MNNYDELTDDEFESLLSDISEGKLDTIDNDEVNDDDIGSNVEENNNNSYEKDNVDDNNIEDTDPGSELDDDNLDESDTNDENDDSYQDTDNEELDSSDEEQEENTQDNDDIQENNDTEEIDNVDSQDNKSSDTINYQEEYQKLLSDIEKYKDFYNKVTSEFVANGKVMKGFTEPEKIIQAQQMAAGFSEKMRAFKQYRPFIEPLKKKGILDNPDKFNLMIDAIDGDQEAIKALLKETNIDPLELNIDEVDYKPKDNLASPITLAYDDLIDTASQFGIDDKVNNIITKEWDDDSVAELLSDTKNSSDLIAHMNNGVYDIVQERIAKKKMTDITGSFSSMRDIDQYRAAVAELEQEYVQQQQMQQQQVMHQSQEPVVQFSEDAIQAEIAKIKAEKEQVKKREQANSKANTARKKAASVSKKKSTMKQTKKVFDPMELSDDEFEKYLLSLQYKE